MEPAGALAKGIVIGINRNGELGYISRKSNPAPFYVNVFGKLVLAALLFFAGKGYFA